MENKANELVVIANESGLETTQAKTILENFTNLFEQAKDWETKAKAIVVTDVSQTDTMLEARKARLALKDIRVNAEKVRKDLKEKSLREGKAIDGIANVIKALVVPIEDYLENQEKFAENLEAERQAKIEAERGLELSKYVEDISLYNFKEMSEEAFLKLIENVKAAFDRQKELEAKAEEERLEKERKHALWEERRFKLEAYHDFFDKETVLTIDTTEEDYNAMLALLVKRKKDWDAKQLEIQKENEKIKAEQKKKDEEHAAELEKERAAKRKLEEEAAKKAEEERLKKEAEKKAEEARLEKERQAKLAPEKDKLTAYAESIRTIQAPTELSKAGLELVKEVEQKLLAISQEIKLKIKNL